MNYEFNCRLFFPEANKADFDKLVKLLEPFKKLAVNINIGKENQENSRIETRESNHDDLSRTTPDANIATWVKTDIEKIVIG